MWLALGGTLALAVVVAAVVTWLGLGALHFKAFQSRAATVRGLSGVPFRWLIRSVRVPAETGMGLAGPVRRPGQD